MDLEETRAFLAVLEHGSFKAAADNLGQPRATLRRRVEALEVRAGTPLLVRSRHGVEVTAAGQVLARHARGLLRETDALLSALREVGDEVPRGLLRVAVPTTLAAAEVARLLAPLRGRYRELRLSLRRVADPLAEPVDAVDLALITITPADGPAKRASAGRAGPGARWSTTPLASFDEGVVASEAYLARHGSPTTLAELGDHAIVGLAGTSGWPLRAGGSVAVELSVACDDVEQLTELTRAGCGLALLADGGRIDAGLQPVLSPLVGRRRALAVAVPEALAQTPKLRAIVAELERVQPRLHALSRRAERAEGAASARLAG